MNKMQLVEQLAVKLGVAHTEAERMLNSFISLVYETLAAGEDVQISGFGKFSVSHRASRLGVNPQKPDIKITIPALNTPKFKAGEAFKEAIKLK